MAGHGWADWFEREEFIGQISDIRVQNLQVEREVVQKRTFTRWMNLHLEKCDPPIEVHDLFQDIQDGRILMALLEELSGCKLLHGFKKSSHRIFRLNNIAKVLSFLEERNVKLVSIDAADVADGNSSIILGLIWNIILFFQIKELTGNIRSQFPSCSSLSSIPTSSDSDASYCSTPSDERQSASTAMREHSKAIKKLLQWVQKRTRKYGVAVQDFGKSWTSGLAFLAVIKSIDASLVDMRKALLRSARENLEDAFRIAHYSLGIPRLLEPEDVTINPPDEQSIITYVSQFLEHFPGIEEPEEPCHLIERSISMGRLNFREIDSDHMRNGTHRSRVKERSYLFQREYTKPAPKILISSVSEDSSARSPPFRPTTARSWSIEDFLADSPHMEDLSTCVVEHSKEPDSEVLNNSTSNSPQLFYTHSPTESSLPEGVNTDSVIGDSAISSPDSWMESDQSDGSLCDSGTAWDVYRATPVEVTPFDEGFVPSIEEKAHDERLIAESYKDEGIYSLERPHEQLQEHLEKTQEGVPKQREDNTDNNQDAKKEHFVDAEVLANSGAHLEVDETAKSNTELPFPDSSEELLKQVSEESTESASLQENVDTTGDAQDHKGQTDDQTRSLDERNNSQASIETECLKVSPVEGRKEGVTGMQNEGVLKDPPSVEESTSTETDTAFANTDPTKQESASSIPLIFISSQQEEQNEKGACDPEKPADSGDEERHQPEATELNGTEANANTPQTPDELSSGSNDVDVTKPVEIDSGPISEQVSELIMGKGNGHLEEMDEHNNRGSQNVEICDLVHDMEMSEVKHESEFAENSSQNIKDVITETTRDEESQPVSPDQDIVVDSEKISTQENTLDSELDGKIGILCGEPVSASRNMDLFYPEFDRSSPAEDLVGDPIEPMDLFYPDKEELILTELPDTEMQSWPSVLSVSALQPAPASEIIPDDQLLNLLDEDFFNGEDLIQDDDKVKSFHQ
uniref:Calmin n=1 Tax=Echeneis naucrates TaxID=173247 RepID=A0A665TLD9_ECHNA